jgi:hypothetical protein
MVTFKTKVMTIKYRLIKVWDTFRYDIPRFIKNIWSFRKGLWQFRSYDPHGIYVMNNIGLTNIADHIEKYGYEVDESRLKKIEKMRRAAQIYKNFMEDTFIEHAEAELGELMIHPWEFVPCADNPDNFELKDKESPEERAHNTAVFTRSKEIEEQQWAELYEILKGQDYSKFDKDIEFYKQFDGTGLRGWWN